MQGGAPIILTADMAAADFAWADGLRRAHYPPGRNVVPAHITLFHHLPPSVEMELIDRMKRLCAGPPPLARLAGVIHLGNGVAYRIDSPELMVMRGELADLFDTVLIPQDRAVPRLHLTIQNKAAAAEASALAKALEADFRPRPLRIAGLAAWRYLGGPWSLIRNIPFRG